MLTHKMSLSLIETAIWKGNNLYHMIRMLLERKLTVVYIPVIILSFTPYLALSCVFCVGHALYIMA